MALATNSALQDIDSDGLQDAIVATGGSQDLADGAYSPASGATHSTIDNSTTKATLARIVLLPLDGFAATPDGGAVHVYVRGIDVDGSAGHNEPSLDAGYKGHYRGDIVIDQATAVAYYETVVSLVGKSRKFQIEIENAAGASLLDDVNGWKVQVELLSLAPKAA